MLTFNASSRFGTAAALNCTSLISLPPRKTGRVVIVSSPRSFWRTTTQHWGTHVTRAGTWPSPAADDHGRARGHGSTNGKSISWRGYRRGSSRSIRATTVLSISSTTLSIKGLNVRDIHRKAEGGEADGQRDGLTNSQLAHLPSQKDL